MFSRNIKNSNSQMKLNSLFLVIAKENTTIATVWEVTASLQNISKKSPGQF